LKLIVEPANNQCPAVQKLALNVKKLEEVTMEALSNWFSDKDHPENAQKKTYLKEIFKVAKAQERFKDGGIGKSSVFHKIDQALSDTHQMEQLVSLFSSVIEMGTRTPTMMTSLKKASRMKTKKAKPLLLPSQIQITWYLLRCFNHKTFINNRNQSSSEADQFPCGTIPSHSLKSTNMTMNHTTNHTSLET
jgi:hypothetical protein